MIALHLDATNADYNIWREYAMCFLKLSQYEEDRMSVCLNGNESGHKPRYSVSFNKTPKIFIKGQSGKSWKLRCRWWSTRHFSHDILASETAAGIYHNLHLQLSQFLYYDSMKAHLCLSRPAQLSRFESFSELFFINNMHLREK